MKNLKRKSYELKTNDKLFKIFKQPKGKFNIWLDSYEYGKQVNKPDVYPKSLKDNLESFNGKYLTLEEIKNILNDLAKDFDIYPLIFESSFYESKTHYFDKDNQGNLKATYKTAYFNKNILPFIKYDKTDLLIDHHPWMKFYLKTKSAKEFKIFLDDHSYNKLALNYFNKNAGIKSAKTFKEAVENLENATEEFMKNKVAVFA